MDEEFREFKMIGETHDRCVIRRCAIICVSSSSAGESATEIYVANDQYWQVEERYEVVLDWLVGAGRIRRID